MMNLGKFLVIVRLWNSDFVEELRNYNLKQINKIECAFLGLTQYNLFVSEELYTEYHMAIIE